MNRNSINVGKKIKTYRKAKKYTLYPEDSIQIAAGKRHCWSNQSNRIVKMLLITVSGSEHEA